MTGQRRGFMRNTFHHAAIAAQRIRAVTKHFEAGPIEVSGLPAGGNRHADAVSQPLAQRAGRGLDP